MERNNRLYYSFQTPIGILTAGEEEGAVISLTIEDKNDIIKNIPAENVFDKDIYMVNENKNQPPSALLAETQKQLTEYFKGNLREFSVPIRPHGTVFQQRVWEELRRIPYGETRSYKEIAIALGNPKAMRAVGGANNRNPIIIINPCHRVIGKRGDLTGYALGLSVKQYLLELEGYNI